jgi:hypothetical protein
MKKVIITEEQEKKLANKLNEEILQMPVDKKMNKPYCINPDKVLLVKNFLDKNFQRGNIEDIGDNGLPRKTRIAAMMPSSGEVLRNLLDSELQDLLIDKYKNMFLDTVERELFMKQVVDDWFNNKISPIGLLSVNKLSI